jgi:hypothetical protein
MINFLVHTWLLHSYYFMQTEDPNCGRMKLDDKFMQTAVSQLDSPVAKIDRIKRNWWRTLLVHSIGITLLSQRTVDWMQHLCCKKERFNANEQFFNPPSNPGTTESVTELVLIVNYIRRLLTLLQKYKQDSCIHFTSKISWAIFCLICALIKKIQFSRFFKKNTCTEITVDSIQFLKKTKR